MQDMNRKSQIWISAVLYVLLITIVIVIVLEGGTPILEGLRDKSVFVQTRDNFVALDSHITEVSNAGPGSQRIVPLEVKKGELTVDNNQIRWEMDTEASIIQPRTSIDAGNLRLGSDSDVNAYESGGNLILENYYITAVFSKVGNESSYNELNASSILLSLTYNPNSETTEGSFSMLIDDSLIDSDGYSKLLDNGYDLGSASVLFHINQSSGIEHDLIFTLDSRADYLKVNLK
ncbi:hypothetical protein GF345_03065 [Candidatus Woesearchaeota archaeon]|nr:hypothetical protein [Candidatus Woesearchaeota archaeon]